MVSRLDHLPVESDATLTVDDGVSNRYVRKVNWRYYPQASLVINDNVRFTAKDGLCKIII